jgi:hypothetical protein
MLNGQFAAVLDLFLLLFQVIFGNQQPVVIWEFG